MGGGGVGRLGGKSREARERTRIDWSGVEA